MFAAIKDIIILYTHDRCENASRTVIYHISYRRQTTDNGFLKPVRIPKSSKILSSTVCVRCNACLQYTRRSFIFHPIAGARRTESIKSPTSFFHTHPNEHRSLCATVNDVSDYRSGHNPVESFSRWPTTTGISKWLPKNVRLGGVIILLWSGNWWPRPTCRIILLYVLGHELAMSWNQMYDGDVCKTRDKVFPTNV